MRSIAFSARVSVERLNFRHKQTGFHGAQPRVEPDLSKTLECSLKQHCNCPKGAKWCKCDCHPKE